MMLRALFSSLVAIGGFLKFLLNAKQTGLVNCLCRLSQNGGKKREKENRERRKDRKKKK